MERAEYNAQTDAARAVRAQLRRMGISQADLERRLGVKPSVVSRALGGSPLDQRSKVWRGMLDELGLEVVIRPKPKPVPVPPMIEQPEADLDEAAMLEASAVDLRDQLAEIEDDVTPKEMAAWLAALEGKSA